jgi:phenylpropionate dioxygenase-like ring-hydroxylating dioxygenase large terminal subunit
MSLSNKYYTKDEYFNLESQIVKNDCWILVGHHAELLKHNDFISFDYLGEKIFVQNYRGEIKAFQNICLHRFNVIHDLSFGNRVSSCLYHCWTYNKEGKVAGLSCKSSFDEGLIENLKLKEYEVQNCGEFIFVKLDPKNELTLNEYLGNLYDKLESFSKHLGGKTTDYNLEHLGNWKLLVENVLECYHCVSVHDNSFAKMGYGFVKPESFDFHNAHSWCEFPKKNGIKENKKIEEILSSRTLKVDGYLHFFIYPNAFISTVEGKGFYMGFLLPNSPGKTNLRVKYFSPKLEDALSDANQNIFDFVIHSSHDSLGVVLNEDKNIIENIQSNLSSVENSVPIFGNEEFRINKFYDYFKEKILDHAKSI